MIINISIHDVCFDDRRYKTLTLHKVSRLDNDVPSTFNGCVLRSCASQIPEERRKVTLLHE